MDVPEIRFGDIGWFRKMIFTIFHLTKKFIKFIKFYKIL